VQKFFLTILLLLAFSSLFSQGYTNILIDKTYEKISFEAFTKQLKAEHQIDVIYNNEWTSEIETPEIKRPLTLDHFLTQTLTSYNLHYLVFQNHIVIMPGGFVTYQNETENSEVIIGNPIDKGKYKTATLSGTVYDGKTNEPIPGVQVICENLSKAVSTDGKGFYEIELPTEKHRIRFSFMGLEDEERDISIYSSGIFNIDLYEKSISIDEINVSAEKPEDNFRSTSMGMVKLSMKSINKLSVLMGEADIIKSMVLLPGVQSTGENASGFNVRGGNADQNLILVHDAPVFNSSHLFGFFSMLDPIVVSDVTLFKSGLPARYGGRISSVMNVELRKGQSEKIKVNGGIGLVNSRLSAEGPIGNKINFIVGARSTYSDWMLKMIKNYDLQNSSANFYDFNAKVDYNINNRNKISLFGYGSNDDFLYFGNAQYSYGNLLASGRWNHIYNNNNSGALSFNLSNYKAQVVDFTQQNMEYNLFTGINQQQLAYHFSSNSVARHKFNAGAGIIAYNIEPGRSTPYNDQSIAQTLDLVNEKAYEANIYIEDEFAITPELAVVAGLRYSGFAHNAQRTINLYPENAPRNSQTLAGTQSFQNNQLSAFKNAAEPRVALRYEFRNSSSVKAGYNRTAQYIRQISNSASITPADYWKAADEYMQPLLADQYAIGYFRNFKQNTYETSFEVYYKDIKNEVDYKNGAQLILNPALEQVLISGIGYAYGAELLIKKNKGDLTGWMAYTYSRSYKKIDGNFAEEKINRGEWYRSNYDKPHDLTLVLNYKLSRRFTFSSNFTYSTGRPVTLPEKKYFVNNYEVISFSDRNKYRLPDYHRLDVAITYEGSLLKQQKWRSSWTLSVYNVYGRNNAFSVFYEKQKPTNANNYNTYGMYKFSVIGVPVPSFTYNFWF